VAVVRVARHEQRRRTALDHLLNGVVERLVEVSGREDFSASGPEVVQAPLAIGDVEVLNFEVPPGYDGLIAGLFNVYTGPGFQDGNGDIEWRLLINRTYAVHLGRIMVSLGGQDQPYPVDGGIFIQSGTRIRYIVNVPNLSGGILPLASQIVCGLEGLFYART
jgi:hypothetical protein